MPRPLLLFILLSIPFSGIGQGLNGGFEAVHDNGLPAGWSKTNTSAASLTSDAFSGDKAAKAWVYDYYRPGGWVSVTNKVGNTNSGQQTSLPSTLSGVYKYEGRKKECEPALVQVMATRRDGNGGIDTLAVGETELWLSKKYQTFSLDVSQMGSAESAEFLTVRLEARGRCDWLIGSNCCFLFADDLQFDENYAAGAPTAEIPGQVGEENVKNDLSEPVFIQPMRKKRKSLFRRYVLKPAKKARTRNKKVRRKKDKKKKADLKAPVQDTPDAPIPPEIKKEIDRINAAQNDPTPDPAKATEEEVPAEKAPADEDNDLPDSGDDE